MAGNTWYNYLVEIVKPYELLLKYIGYQIRVPRNRSITEELLLHEKIKEKIFTEGFYDPFLNPSMDVSIVNKPAYNEIIWNFIDDTAKVIAEVANSLLDWKISFESNYLSLFYNLKKESASLFRRIGDATGRKIPVKLRSKTLKYRSNLSIIGAIKRIYEDEIMRPLVRYIKFDGGTISEEISIYRYFCSDLWKKSNLDKNFLMVLNELSELEEREITEICESLEYDLRVNGRNYKTTLKKVVYKCPKFKGNREAVKNVISIFDCLTKPLGNYSSSQILKSAFNLLIVQKMLLEVEVFKRIVNLGYFAIPRVRISMSESDSLSGEIDIIVPSAFVGKEDRKLLLIEVTTRSDLKDKLDRIRKITEKLHERLYGGLSEHVKVSNIIICDSDESVEDRYLISFYQLDEKLKTVLRDMVQLKSVDDYLEYLLYLAM